MTKLKKKKKKKKEKKKIFFLVIFILLACANSLEIGYCTVNNRILYYYLPDTCQYYSALELYVIVASHTSKIYYFNDPLCENKNATERNTKMFYQCAKPKLGVDYTILY